MQRWAVNLTQESSKRNGCWGSGGEEDRIFALKCPDAWLLFASHSTNWPRNTWSSKSMRPSLLTVRSTLEATSLACLWTPLVLWNTQMLELEEKAPSPRRSLLNPLERAPSKTRRAQVDARGRNVLPYQDVAQGIKWEQWQCGLLRFCKELVFPLFCFSCDSPGLSADYRREPVVWLSQSLFSYDFITYPVRVPFQTGTHE